jgi:hypothetical protein
MSDIEKRARDLLAAEWESRGAWVEASFVRGPMYAGDPVLCAIVAALTPPEGFVLVPVDSVKQCACGCHRYCCVHCGTELGGLSARPEVSP